MRMYTSGLDGDDGPLVPAVAEEPLYPDPGQPRALQQLRGGLHLALHPRHAHPPPQLQRHHHHAPCTPGTSFLDNLH